MSFAVGSSGHESFETGVAIARRGFRHPRCQVRHFEIGKGRHSGDRSVRGPSVPRPANARLFQRIASNFEADDLMLRRGIRIQESGSGSRRSKRERYSNRSDDRSYVRMSQRHGGRNHGGVLDVREEERVSATRKVSRCQSSRCDVHENEDERFQHSEDVLWTDELDARRRTRLSHRRGSGSPLRRGTRPAHAPGATEFSATTEASHPTFSTSQPAEFASFSVATAGASYATSLATPSVATAESS